MVIHGWIQSEFGHSLLCFCSRIAQLMRIVAGLLQEEGSLPRHSSWKPRKARWTQQEVSILFITLLEGNQRCAFVGTTTPVFGFVKVKSLCVSESRKLVPISVTSTFVTSLLLILVHVLMKFLSTDRSCKVVELFGYKEVTR